MGRLRRVGSRDRRIVGGLLCEIFVGMMGLRWRGGEVGCDMCDWDCVIPTLLRHKRILANDNDLYEDSTVRFQLDYMHL